MDKNINEPVKETENKDNNLTSKEETQAMQELQKGYEKQIEKLKLHYEEEIKSLKSEHTKQIRNILLGKDLIKESEVDDDENELKELIKEINERR